MVPSFRPSIAALFVLAVLGSCVASVAQSYGPASCTESDVKADLHFYQAPQGVRVVAIEYRNIGNGTCILDVFEPLTLRDRKTTAQRYFAPLTLQKGDVVHSSIRWGTSDPNPRIDCTWIESLPFRAPPIPNPLENIGAAVLVPSACSPLKQTEYLPGPFVPDWKPDGTVEKPPPSAPVVTTDKQAYYSFEPIELHVKLTDRPASASTCPYLIEKVEDAQNNTRLIEVVDPKFGCHYVPAGMPDWTGPSNEFAIRVGGSQSYGVNGLSENTFTIYQVADPTPYGELRLVPSNSVTVKIVPSPRDCLPGDLAPALHFYRRNDKMAVVALDYHNSGDSACRLTGVGAENGMAKYLPAVVIDPGETVHTSYRRTSSGDQTSNPCQGFFNLGSVQPGPTVTLLAPTLVPPPCAALMPKEYRPGPFVPDWKAEKSEPAPLPPAPVLIAPKTTYDEGEIIELRLRTGTPDMAGEKCPLLFESKRDDGGYSFREISMGLANTPHGCKAYSPWLGYNPQNGESPWLANEYPIEIEPNGVRGLNTPGKRTIAVSALAGTAPDGEMRLVSSNTVTLDVVDPATIQRNWGKEKEGVRADLTLDKLSYPLGEDIPLHIAFENLSPATAVYGRPFGSSRCAFEHLLSPEIDYTVTVENEDGSKPKFFELPLTMHADFGKPYRPFPPKPIAKGKIIPVEDNLMRLGLLPREPGIYKIALSWSAYESPNPSEDNDNPGAATAQKPLVTVTSELLTLRITPAEDVH